MDADLLVLPVLDRDTVRAPKEPYRAAVPFLANEERFCLTAFLGNTIRDINYAYFVESISTAPTRLAWVYTNGVLSIRGENARALRPLLKERRVSELHVFDETRHLPPAPDEPIIRELEWCYAEELPGGKRG